MGMPAQSSVPMPDFPGLVTATDPHDVPAGGAIDLVNATCVRPGQLLVRPGFRVVTFD